jgi:hypothetical protein
LSFCDPSKPFDISLINSTRPIMRSLSDHLTNLFAELFSAPAMQGKNIIQLECTYEYALSSGPLSQDFSPISLPVFLLSPSIFEGATTIASLCTAIHIWFTTHIPVEEDGTFYFDLTVMSSLTVPPMPLLRLQYLKLDLEYINRPVL